MARLRSNLTLLCFIVGGVLGTYVFAADYPSERGILRCPCPLSPTGKAKVLYLDVDGTIRIIQSGGPVARSPEDVVILPLTVDMLLKYQASGYLLALVSNQGGIPRNASFAQIQKGMHYTLQHLAARGVRIHFYDFAAGTEPELAKPNTLMAARLERQLREQLGPRFTGIDNAASLMVGDGFFDTREWRTDGTRGFHHNNFDRLFGEKLGVRTVEAAEFFGWTDFGVRALRDAAELQVFYHHFAATDPVLQRRKLLQPYEISSNRQIPVAFLDADGSLRTFDGEGKDRRVILLPGVADTIAELKRLGYFIFVVSNQSSTPRERTYRHSDSSLHATIQLLNEFGAPVHAFDFAGGFAKEDLKPNTGMARRLERILNEFFGGPVQVDWQASFMVGDLDETDVRFAHQLGIRSFEARRFYQWSQKGLTVKEPTLKDLALFSRTFHSKQGMDLESYSFCTKLLDSSKL